MPTFAPQELYNEAYYKNYVGASYERGETEWINFFGNIAHRIVNDFNPQSTLDAGCAIGMLVEILRRRGVDAFGFDVSEWAVKQMPQEYARFVKAGSILDSKIFNRKFDLVTCIEVLEHLDPSDADQAIQNLCGWGDLVIFTSSPDAYDEPTHFNVQQPGYWAEKFAQNGFVRVLDYDASFIAPWAQVYRRERIVFSWLARQYENKFWINRKQIQTQQATIVKLQQKIDRQYNDVEQFKAEAAQSKIAAEQSKAESERIAEQAKIGESNLLEANAESQRLLQETVAERELLRQQLIAEREQLQAATENLRVLTESHSRLQSNHKSLRELHSKLEDSRAKLQESHENLKEEHQQTLQQLQDASEFIEKISRTKAWRTVEFWWKSKHKVVSWLPQKQARVKALQNTSLFILQNQGHAALVNRTYRFLRGERHNTNIDSNSLPTTFSPNGEVQMDEAPVVETTYEQWIQRNEPTHFTLKQQVKHELDLEYRPLISVLTPVYNTDDTMLRKMIDSVLRQTYSNWELCLVDGCSVNPHVRRILDEYARQDSRVRVKYLNDNLGISGNSNEAVNMAAGEFIALLDHDDELTPNALYENVLLLNRHQDADMIYSDEDKLDAGGARCFPCFKPDWSPDLFRSIMYTCHFGVYRTGLIKSIGRFRHGFDGSQDHDLVLRLIEKTNRIHHIPKILYHWRMSPGSTALNSEAKGYAEAARLKAVQEHCERRGLKGIAEPGLFNGAVRLRYLPETSPLVSIIIPTRDRFSVLRQCVNSILKLSTYENYEILIIDNDSSELETLKYLNLLEKQAKIRVLRYSGEFNFSAINNFAAAATGGELLLFLNNDTEVISADWLEAMIEHAVRPEVGAVGARLMYPNNTVQHAGVIIGMGGIAGHAHINLPFDDPGYFGRVHVIQNFSAVTGACLMTKAELFKDLNGFNEQDLAVAFNDVDFCLRLREKNLLIVYTPYAELYHYESLSRGSDLSPENIERFKREIEYTESKWRKMIGCDPYYNPNLSLDLSLGTFTLAPFSRAANSAAFETQQPEDF